MSQGNPNLLLVKNETMSNCEIWLTRQGILDLPQEVMELVVIMEGITKMFQKGKVRHR